MITLLQCTSMYPIPDKEVNLAVMQSLKELGTSVGYSDHSVGSEALKMASILGAEMLEFHFSDDKSNSNFRDHLVSLEDNDVVGLYSFFDQCQDFYGNSVKEPTKSEVHAGHIKSFRRGTYSSRDLLAGTVLEDTDIIEKRPVNDGLEYESLIGSVLINDILKGSSINVRDCKK